MEDSSERRCGPIEIPACAPGPNFNFDKNIEQPALAKHDSSILDLAFVIDCTGSMGSYIQSATDVIF